MGMVPSHRTEIRVWFVRLGHRVVCEEARALQGEACRACEHTALGRSTVLRSVTRSLMDCVGIASTIVKVDLRAGPQTVDDRVAKRDSVVAWGLLV